MQNRSEEGMSGDTPPLLSTCYVCYVLVSSGNRKTYAGSTNNLVRRLRQHRGQIRGGARATSSFGTSAKYLFVVSGFDGKRSALRFEWRLKQHRGWYKVLKGTPVSKRWLLLQFALQWASVHLPHLRLLVHRSPDHST